MNVPKPIAEAVVYVVASNLIKIEVASDDFAEWLKEHAPNYGAFHPLNGMNTYVRTYHLAVSHLYATADVVAQICDNGATRTGQAPQ